MAHMLAHLRIGGPVARTVARLASGRCRSTISGRDSHPLDDISEFQEVIASFHPF